MGRHSYIAGHNPRLFAGLVADCPFDQPTIFDVNSPRRSRASIGYRADKERSVAVRVQNAFAPNYFWIELVDYWNRSHTIPAPRHRDDWLKLEEFWELEDVQWQYGFYRDAAFPFTYPREAMRHPTKGYINRFYVCANTGDWSKPEQTKAVMGFSKSPYLSMPKGWKLLTVGPSSFGGLQPLVEMDAPPMNEETALSHELLEAIAVIGATTARGIVWPKGERAWTPHFKAPENLPTESKFYDRVMKAKMKPIPVLGVTEENRRVEEEAQGAIDDLSDMDFGDEDEEA